MAVNEITKVRGKFVDKVSNALILQLLDDILEDGVLNDGERESIIEENRTRAEKARSLIDTVKRKGDAACMLFILHLRSRDPTLCTELGL